MKFISSSIVVSLNNNYIKKSCWIQWFHTSIILNFCIHCYHLILVIRLWLSLWFNRSKLLIFIFILSLLFTIKLNEAPDSSALEGIDRTSSITCKIEGGLYRSVNDHTNIWFFDVRRSNNLFRLWFDKCSIQSFVRHTKWRSHRG